MGSSVILPPTGQPATGADPAFKSQTRVPLVSWSFDDIKYGGPIYISVDDFLAVSIFNSVANIQVIVEGRILRAPIQLPPDQRDPNVPTQVAMLRGGGGIEEFQFIFTPDATRNVNPFVRQLSEGFLISVNIATLTLGVEPGQCFVSTGIQRTSAAQARNVNLISGYVMHGYDFSWPGGSLRYPLDGAGFVHSQVVGNPPAGSDWILTCPGFARWRIESFVATLTTSATVANRQVQIIIDDGANQYWVHDPATAIAASSTGVIIGTMTNAPTGVFPNIQSVVLPPNLYLPAAHRIRSNTQGLQAGDQWSAIVFGVEEWIDF